MDETVTVIVEIPKGSRNKYEMDHETGRIRLDRTLFASVHYPADYGFIDQTLGEDGDPLDALVLVAEPTFPGCEIEARPVGVFRMRDDKGIDHKILCVPVSDPLWSPIVALKQVPPHLLVEIEHFFNVYKTLEGKETVTAGWDDEEAASIVVSESYLRATAEGGV
ncbi:MAG: inorganic diphosphatase [Actinomycetota bacterium]